MLGNRRVHQTADHERLLANVARHAVADLQRGDGVGVFPFGDLQPGPQREDAGHLAELLHLGQQYLEHWPCRNGTSQLQCSRRTASSSCFFTSAKEINEFSRPIARQLVERRFQPVFKLTEIARQASCWSDGSLRNMHP